MNIRWMTRADIFDAAIIEKHSKENLWCEEDFLRICHHPKIIPYILEQPTRINSVVGFVICKLQFATLDILNLVIHEDYRRNRLGTKLIDYVKKQNKNTWKRDKIVFDVRESNLDGHLFLQKNGFIAGDVQKDWFKDSLGENIKAEDAYIFTFDKD